MKKLERFFKVPDQSFFLLGPRGTGKSTLIKDIFKEAVYLDFLLPDVFRSFSARPERLKEVVFGNRDKQVFVLDEVQKVPELLSVVHSLLEEKKDWKFVLTGSSARKLKRAGVDMLAGRALMKHLHPFIATELGTMFNLDAALQNGLIPVVLNSQDPAASLQAYLNLYIREEVQMEGLVRNIGDFSRFLETISFSHGSVLNISNIARECQVERKVVESYITILEDLLLAFRIPVFAKRAKRVLSNHPKFYLFDAGVFKALRPSGPLDRPQEKAGAALEGLIAQHLRAWIDYNNLDAKLYFWRTSSGNEVDFVVYGSTVFTAIEVKSSNNISAEDLRPLKAFGQDYPEAKRILVYRGRETLEQSGISIKPCEDFLQSPLATASPSDQHPR